MLNILDNEVIYGSSYEQVGEARYFNERELNRLNVDCPAVVFMGKYSLSAKLFVAGSTSMYYCKNIDTHSTVVEGQMFDVRKCKITVWKKPEGSELKVKLLVLDDAIIR